MNNIDLFKSIVMIIIITLLVLYIGSLGKIIILILLISIYIVLDNWDKYRFMVDSYSKAISGKRKK